MKVLKGDKSRCSIKDFLHADAMWNYTATKATRLLWYLKQLLPLTYRTTYTDTKTKDRHFTVWNMWFGRCFNIDDYVIGKSNLDSEV